MTLQKANGNDKWYQVFCSSWGKGVGVHYKLGPKHCPWVWQRCFVGASLTLFRGSWSLLKRKGRQEHEWWPTVHRLSPFPSLLSITGAHMLVSLALVTQDLQKPRGAAAYQASRPKSQLLSKVIHKILTWGRHWPPPKDHSPRDTHTNKLRHTVPLYSSPAKNVNRDSSGIQS